MGSHSGHILTILSISYLIAFWFFWLLVTSLNVTILFVMLAFQSKDLVLAKSETMVLLSIDEKIVPVDIVRPLAQVRKWYWGVLMI